MSLWCICRHFGSRAQSAFTKRPCIVWVAHSRCDRTPASIRLVEENGSRQLQDCCAHTLGTLTVSGYNGQ
eukprot:5524598-Heterocapsa_arctica.AAC.1